MAFSKLLILID